MPEKLKVGDRVRRSDADDPSQLGEDGRPRVPAYVAMRGTVIGFDWSYVLVQWDCDPRGNPTRHLPECVAHAED